MTLLIAATLTWYICVGLLPWEYLGDGVNGSVAPLFDAARLTGSNPLIWLLGVGTLFATLAIGQRLYQRRLAGMVCDGPRQVSAGLVRRGASEVPHALPVDHLSGAHRARSSP